MAEAVKVAVRRGGDGAGGAPTKKLTVRFGRGRLGGTTYLDALAQRALRAGRPVILVDADVRNPSLSRLYPPARDGDGRPVPGTGARVPDGEGIEAFDAMMKAVLDELARHPGPVSALLDIGGGQDRTLAEFIRDLNLSRYCRRIGVLPVAVYMVGPDEDDLKHALSVRDAGLFDNDNAVLVMNEALVKRSQSPMAAFAAVRGNGEYQAWVLEGAARPVWMRNLGCLETVRALGLGLAEAAEGKAGAGGRRLGPTEAWQVEDWMDHLAEQHEKAEALDLLP